MTDTQEGSGLPETEQAQQEDYFGFGGEEKFTFPDEVSFVTFKVMNEGQRKKFQTLTQRDMVLERRSGDARLGMNPSDERHALLRTSITSWNLKRGSRAIPFTERGLLDFLDLSNPILIDAIEKAIRQANPWLLGDMTSEDIDKEIINLQDMREVALKRELGEGSSSSR